MQRSIGEVKKGFGVQLFPADPEAVIAVVQEPEADSAEEKYLFGTSTLLDGREVPSLLAGERGIDDVLQPDPQNSRAFEIGKGTLLLFERADEPGHYDIVRGPARAEEVGLASFI